MYLLQNCWVFPVLYDKAGIQNNGNLNNDFINFVWNASEQPGNHSLVLNPVW